MFRTVIALSLTLTPTLLAADWPQFLGPNRDNATPDVIAEWKDTPKPVWSKPVGEAHSAPVVANGVVYAFFRPGQENADALAAFDAATGEKKWEKSYPREKFSPPFGTGPRGTPCVDGGFVYTFGGTGILACWDAKTGDVKWKVDTLKEFKAKNLFFGISTSPTVVGENVVVMVGGKDAGVVAFAKKTGEVAWKTTSDAASYATPLTLGKGGADGLVFLTGSHVRGLSAAGKQLWAVPFKDKLNESSTTPVKAGGLIVASSVTAGSIAFDPGAIVKIPEFTPTWKDEKLTCYFSTPVAVGQHLYMVNGAATLTNPSITLRCVEAATGNVKWSKEKYGKYHAALVRTGDDKLLVLDDAGHLMLVEPSAEGYKELAKSKVCGPTWAHPAVADGRVFVRDDKELHCFKLGK
jgi:outer membrane protein assembly factor BamB